MTKTKTNKSNINYAIYDNKDHYLYGCDTLKEVGEFFGNKDSKAARQKAYLSRNLFPVVKTLVEEDGRVFYSCSQKLYEYRYTATSESDLEYKEGMSVYSFWDEE